MLDLLNFALQSGPGEEFGADVRASRWPRAARRDGMVLLDEGPLGRLGATERLEGYASAVLSSVRGERRLGDVEDELFRFMRIVEGNEELTGGPDHCRAACRRPRFGRRRPLGEAGDPGVGPHGHLCQHASGARAISRSCSEALVELVAKEANRRVADVRSAVELTAAAAVPPDCGPDEVHRVTRSTSGPRPTRSFSAVLSRLSATS